MQGDLVVSVPTGLLWSLARWAMPPVVEFLAPSQRQKRDAEHISWWHIPVTVRRKFRWIGPSSLPVGEFLLVFRDEDGSEMVLNMGVGDAVVRKTYARTALQEGEVVLVPIVKRDEKDEKKGALVTDARFLEKGQENYRFPNDRIKRVLRLRFKHGKKIHESHPYILRVPITASNGQFTLECQYQGFGTRSDQ